MIPTTLFDRYKSMEIKPHQDGLLFDIDWDAVRKTNRCPYCGSKLYASRKFVGYILCRNKTHRFFKIKEYKKLSPTGASKKLAPKSFV